jgi:predicted protein tyrosine phosphatase
MLAESNQLLRLIAQAAAAALAQRAEMQLTGETVALAQILIVIGRRRHLLA